jgi:hypothetical protein
LHEAKKYFSLSLFLADYEERQLDTAGAAVESSHAGSHGSKPKKGIIPTCKTENVTGLFGRN